MHTSGKGSENDHVQMTTSFDLFLTFYATLNLLIGNFEFLLL